MYNVCESVQPTYKTSLLFVTTSDNRALLYGITPNLSTTRTRHKIQIFNYVQNTYSCTLTFTLVHLLTYQILETENCP